MDKTWMDAEARYKYNEDDGISDLLRDLGAGLDDGGDFEDNSSDIEPCEELRYFPIKKMLQRLFLNSKTASLMRWHDEDRKKDGLLRHPADSICFSRDALVGEDVILYAMLRSDPVAKGTITSTNPNTVLGGSPVRC